MSESFEQLGCPGWKVWRAVRIKDAIYKWHVYGWNRFTGQPFRWAVPDIDRGFDLEGAVIINDPNVSPSRGTEYWI